MARKKSYLGRAKGFGRQRIVRRKPRMRGVREIHVAKIPTIER